MTCSIDAGMIPCASEKETAVVYPSMITRAVALLDEDPFLRTLPHTVWAVLFRLIKKVNVNDLTQPIFASRTTLAKESKESMANLSRQLRTLEEFGIIVRDHKARAGLKGSSSEISFTQKAIHALMLDLPAPGELKQTIRRRKVDGQGKVDYVDSGLIRVGKFRLPQELAVLVTAGGIKATGVMKLMQLAKAAGQRLSDVIQAVKKHISALRGSQLFGYLKKVCTGYRDFAADKAQSIKEEAGRKEREQQEAMRLKIEASTEKQQQDLRSKKSKLIAGLSQMDLARLKQDWADSRKGLPIETGHVGDLIFKTWLRGLSESQLMGNVDNFIHIIYQK